MDIRQHGSAVYVGMVVVVCIPIIYMYSTKTVSQLMNLIFALCGCGVSFYCANTPLARVDGDCH